MLFCVDVSFEEVSNDGCPLVCSMIQWIGNDFVPEMRKGIKFRKTCRSIYKWTLTGKCGEVCVGVSNHSCENNCFFVAILSLIFKTIFFFLSHYSLRKSNVLKQTKTACFSSIPLVFLLTEKQNKKKLENKNKTIKLKRIREKQVLNKRKITTENSIHVACTPYPHKVQYFSPHSKHYYDNPKTSMLTSPKLTYSHANSREVIYFPYQGKSRYSLISKRTSILSRNPQ